MFVYQLFQYACVHGDQFDYPSSNVIIQIGDWTNMVKVAVIPNVPVIS